MTSLVMKLNLDGDYKGIFVQDYDYPDAMIPLLNNYNNFELDELLSKGNIQELGSNIQETIYCNDNSGFLMPLKVLNNLIQTMKVDDTEIYYIYITESDFVWKYYTNSGVLYWTKNGKVHNENGAAVIYKDGTEKYFVNGVLHRENGPAIKYSHGTEYWFFNGKLHNEKGPSTLVFDVNGDITEIDFHIKGKKVELNELKDEAVIKNFMKMKYEVEL